MSNKTRFLLLSLLSGLLLSLSWYWHLTIFIFFAFVPLLVIEDKLSTATEFKRSRLSLFAYAYLSFITWNLLVTWWVVYASLGGASLAFICNSLLMACVVMVYSSVKKRMGRFASPLLLAPLWMAWEHFHTTWDLTWTWLSLGNVFAYQTKWIQWYEFTGASGGTLWVLLVNALVFNVIKTGTSLRFYSRPLLKIAAAIVLPILLSYCVLFYRSSTTPSKVLGTEVVIVQPNIDPYNEKFYLDYQSQFVKALNLARPYLTSKTEYLVLPETFITDDINDAALRHDPAIQWFRDSLNTRFPNLKIVTGANTYAFFEPDTKPSATARKDERSGKYYDVYNSAVYISANDAQVYHKSKLVPGVERMPFPALFKPLESLAINMGGTMGSLGTQEERSVFKDNVSGISIAPVICYESVYGDYTTGYVRNGANFIFIITNDGWWEDTPGYRQHLNYARLRAIENRREIARCANTGISCFIDAFGTIHQPTNWWVETVITGKMKAASELTFFSQYGDLLSYSALALSLLLVLSSLYLRFRK